jgi:hypothetical protein
MNLSAVLPLFFSINIGSSNVQPERMRNIIIIFRWRLYQFIMFERSEHSCFVCLHGNRGFNAIPFVLLNFFPPSLSLSRNEKIVNGSKSAHADVFPAYTSVASSPSFASAQIIELFTLFSISSITLAKGTAAMIYN